jgi:hypothetical protein
MSELRSAIDALRTESLAELPDARIEEDFDELHRAVEQLEAERLRRLAEIERRGLFQRDGHLSAAAWLADRHRVSPGAARDHVRFAGALRTMPATARALEAGQVSLSGARVLAAAQTAEPDAFSGDEELLLAAARLHSVRDLGRAVAFWRMRVEVERGDDPEETLLARRRLHASVLLDGMVRVDGDLDPETGESLLTALRAVMDAEARAPGADQDPRTPAQRRADALGEVCRQWLDRPDRPIVAGERPHVTLTVAVESLAGEDRTAALSGMAADGAAPDGALSHDGVPEPPHLDHVGPVTTTTARRLTCDAAVMRIVMAGPSEPLDIGRRTKVVSPPLRRAVIVRDRGCRFPGCDRPHTWCDAHHVVHWADGGPTSFDNLLLLCRPHHRLIHRPGGFTLDVLHGRPMFRRPDGSTLGDRAPP